MSCAIVVPCYNEEKRLKLQAMDVYAHEHPDVHFFFVNDGSCDATAKILADFSSKNFTVFNLEKNYGKAEAVRYGVEQVLCCEMYDEIGFWDADLSTDLTELTFFRAALKQGHCLVIGCRLRRLGCGVKRSFIRHLAGRIIATIISCHLRLTVYDTQCGAKLFNTAVAKTISEKKFRSGWFFDVEILERLLALWGKDKVEKSVLELPLTSWTEIPNSKTSVVATLSGLCKLLFRKK